MIRSMRTLRVLSFTAAALLAPFASGLPAGAQGAGLEQGWLLAIEHPCEHWKGTEYRCLSDQKKFKNYQTQSVAIHNISPGTVTVQWDEFHTGCGTLGDRIQHHQFTLAKDQVIGPFLLAPGNTITCREVFLVGCTEGGRSKSCPDVITAVHKSWKGSDQ